ncbi:MAG: FecR family protein [Candidatus Omnitrophota bacterium]
MRKYTILAVITFLFASIAVVALAKEANYIGRYTYIDGRVDTLRGEADSPVPAVIGDKICEGDTIRAKSYSKAEITFNDNSLLRLAPNTRVLVEEYTLDVDSKRENASLKLFRGKIRTIVSKTKGPTNFNIETPNASGDIKGSDIFTIYQGGKTSVLVNHGSIYTSSLLYPDNIIKVNKGDLLSIPHGQLPADPRKYLEAEMKLHSKDTDPPIERMIERKDLTVMTGWIVKLSGNVMILEKDGADWRHAALNASLDEGDEVKTGDDGIVEIRLENGNVIYLNPNSVVTLRKMRLDPKTGDYENFLDAKFGKLKVVVDKLKGKSKFEVKTPTAVCGIRGTIMYLDILPELTRAHYEGGAGVVESLISGMKKLLDAGQNTRADVQGSVSDPVFTTDLERSQFDDMWVSYGGVDGYSSPQDNTGEGGGLEVVGDLGNTGTDTTDDTHRPFSDVPFQDRRPLKVPVPPADAALRGVFTGRFGYFDNDGVFEYDMDKKSGLEGMLVDYTDPETWVRPVVMTLGGIYQNPNDLRLWAGDVAGDTINDTSFLGRIVGYFKNSWDGIFAVVHVGPANTQGLRSAGIAIGRFLNGNNEQPDPDVNAGFLFGKSRIALDIPFEDDMVISPGDIIDSFQNPDRMMVNLVSSAESDVIFGGRLTLDVFEITGEGSREYWDLWEAKPFFFYDSDGYEEWTVMVTNDADIADGDEYPREGSEDSLFYLSMNGHDTLGPNSGDLRVDVAGFGFTDFDYESGFGYRELGTIFGTLFGGYAGDEVEIFRGVGLGLSTNDIISGFADGWYSNPHDAMVLAGEGSGAFMMDGEPSGAISVDNLFGGKVEFDFTPGALDNEDTPEAMPLGAWVLSARGTYEEPTSEDWHLVLRGGGYEGLFAPDTERELEPGLVWLGTLDGEADDAGNLIGGFSGFWFSEDGAGVARSGFDDFVGTYVEGEAFTWEVVGGGQWVEVTDLIDLDALEIDLMEFVSFPVTEVHSAILSGGTGSFIDATGTLSNIIMNIRSYQNEIGNPWFTHITGDYDGDITNDWRAIWDNSDTELYVSNTELGEDGSMQVDIGVVHNGIVVSGPGGGSCGEGKLELLGVLLPSGTLD